MSAKSILRDGIISPVAGAQFADALAFIPGLFLLLVPVADRFIDIDDAIKFVFDQDS